MRKKVIMIILTLALTAILATNVLAISGDEIIKKVYNRKTGESSHSLMSMDLIDKDGEVRSRVLEMWSMTYDQENDLSKSVTEFISPASVKGTRFLQVENVSRADDKYIYMPALGRIRRIAASESNSSFMGSDFSYDDMESRDVDEDNHKLLREEKLGKYECYVIESIPKDLNENQYAKRIQWISKEHFIPVKVEYYSKKTEEIQKVLTVKQNIEKVNGIWTIFSTMMENKETGHSTRFYVKRSNSGASYIEYNIKINPRRFTTNFLKTGKY